MMKTVIELLQLSTQFLREKGIAAARRCAEELLAHCLQLSRMQLYLDYDRPLEEDELQRFRCCIKRCATGEPLNYILGEIAFCGCPLQLTSAALIPRQETELLCEQIIQELQKDSALAGKTLWDIATGSGCLGLALKKRFMALEVVLADICPKALALAGANAQRNQLSVTMRQGDLLEPFASEKAHFVVCNPPYISAEEWPQLERSVRDFEPYQALVSGPSGLECYQRLAALLPSYLHDGAKIWFEIGHQQGQAMLALFSAEIWQQCHLTADLAGHQRFFSATYICRE